MMPAILAEQSLRHSQEIALGTGSLRKGEAERIYRRWQSQAQVHDGPPRVVKPIDPVHDESDRLLLESIGIKTTIIKKEPGGATE